MARSLGVSAETRHRWRAEYGAVDRDAVKRLKDLEKENARLKRRVAGQHWSTRLRTVPPNPYRDRLVARMRELALANPRRGRRHVMDLLHRERWSVGARPMKRLWRQEGLLVPQRCVKRRRIGTGGNGIELTAIRGAPAHLRADNGPANVSKAVKTWCEVSGTGALSIDPGSPWQNGIMESFSGRPRDEMLSSEFFDTLAEARDLIDRWRLHYNLRRIEQVLGMVTAAAFAAGCPAPPPLRLAALAYAAAAPGVDGAATLHQLS